MRTLMLVTLMLATPALAASKPSKAVQAVKTATVTKLTAPLTDTHTAPAGVPTLPALPGLAQPVSIQAGGTFTLPTAIALIAHSAGLNVINRDAPALPLTQSLSGLTARAALYLILDNYKDRVAAVVSGNTLIIGRPDTIAALKDQGGLQVVQAAVTADQATALEAAVPNLKVTPFGDWTLLSGPRRATDTATALLSRTAAPVTPSSPAAPSVRASVNITPLSSSDVKDALGAAWPDLKVGALPGAVLLSGTQGDVDSATTLLRKLQADAEGAAQTAAAARDLAQRAASSMRQETPSAPAAVPDVTVRVPLDLDLQTLTALAGSIGAIKVTAITDGMFSVTGQRQDVTDLVAAAHDLEARQGSLPSVTYAVRGSLSDAQASLKRVMPSLGVQLLSGSHQLLVTGTPAQQAQVVGLLKQVDRVTASSDDDTETQIVKLSFAQATTVVKSLAGGGSSDGAAPISSSAATLASATVTPTPTLAGQAPTSTAGGSVAAPTASAAGLTVTADERTNSVILSGPRRLVEQAKVVLLSLDTTLPNIAVHLKVQEVSNSDGTDLGVDWKGSVAGFSVGGGSGGLSVGYTPAAAAPSVSVNLAASKALTNARTLLDTDLTTQEGRRSTLLSGGQILVPVINTTSTGSTATTTTTRETYNYGLEIALTPRLAPDGTVELTLALTLGDKPTTDTNNIIDVAKRTVTTIVTVKPGVPLNLGGLITEDTSEGNKGVPFLSQIPIIGALFGHQSASRSSSVLIITLTATPDRQASADRSGDNGVTVTTTSTSGAPAAAATPAPTSVPAINPAAAAAAATLALPAPSSASTGNGASSTAIPAAPSGK